MKGWRDMSVIEFVLSDEFAYLFIAAWVGFIFGQKANVLQPIGQIYVNMLFIIVNH